MISIAEIVMEMHSKHHVHGNIKLSNIFYRKNKCEITLGTPIYSQIKKWKII
jgi:tRNA A-37 threonylcarbamoyl transferase component Bud32